MNYSQIEFVTSFGRPDQLPPSDRPEIAFSGHSNVGKSTLINKLFSRKNLARTSSQPGKTATVNFYSSSGVYLADLPGYGYARRSYEEKQRWAELMETYFGSGRDIALTVQILDLRHPPTDDDLTMLDYLSRSGMDFIVVLTKADKLSTAELTQRRLLSAGELAPFAQSEAVEFSAVTGAGLERLRCLISDAADKAAAAADTEV